MEAPTIKKVIVFVDDEQRVLDGLKRMLYPMRNEWDMFFATSGAEALEMLGKVSCDVIVSDMRMPMMDGAELLSLVKERYPHVIRFILSGFGDKEMIMRTLESTDQFLSKPCDPTVLKNTILKALEVQRLLDKKQLRAMVSEMKSLPTLPDLYIKLRERLDSPKSSFSDIADVVAKDVSVTAKVLQLVNSAFFGLKHRIDNIQHAVTYLGIETLKAVVLTTDVFSKFSEKEIELFHIRELYSHSIFVGSFAKRIAMDVIRDEKHIDEIGMAGILHDIGKVILIRNKTEEYLKIYEKQQETKAPYDVIERSVLGVSHAHVGGYLMGLWGIPDAIVEAISYHHTPLRSIGTSVSTMSLVYIANVLVHEQCTNAVLKEKISLDEDYVELVGLKKYVPQWRALCKEVYEKHRSEYERLS